MIGAIIGDIVGSVYEWASDDTQFLTQKRQHDSNVRPPTLPAARRRMQGVSERKLH